MTLRLDYLPIQTNYSSDIHEGVNRETLLDGGMSRKRSDQATPWHTVQCTWLVPRAEYDVFMGFFRTTLKNGSQPFLLDLITDIGLPTTHVCRTIGGEPKLIRQSGDGYWMQATLQAKANPTVTSYAVINTTEDRWFFDGLDDRVFVTANSLDFERNQTFTISAWIEVFSVPNVQPRIFNRTRTSDGRGYYLGIEDVNRRLRFQVGGGASNLLAIDSSSALPLNQLLHVVATYSGGSAPASVQLYINSSIQTKVTVGNALTQNVAGAGIPTIGNTSGGTRPWHGRIQSLSIWNAALSQAQVSEMFAGGIEFNASLASFASSLRAFWRLNDPDEPRYANGIVDRSGNSVHATAAYGFADPWVWDGVNDRITMGDILPKNINDAFTVAGYFRQDSVAGHLVSKYDTALTKGYRLFINTTGTGEIDFRLENKDTATFNRIVVQSTATGWADNTMRHIAASYNGSGLASGVKLYVNGIQIVSHVEANGDTLTLSPVSSASFNIGGAGDAGSVGGGNMKALHVSIWNRVLTDSEILEIGSSDASSAPNLRSLSFSSALEAWWKLDGSDTTAIAGGVNDYSGNQRNGTAVNGLGTAFPDTVSELVTGAIITYQSSVSDWQFDGIDDTITIGDVHDKAAGTAFSVSGWFATKQGGGAFTSEARLFAKRGASGNFSGWGVLFTSVSAKLVWAYGGPDSGGARRSEIFTNAGWADGNLHNFVCTKSTNNTVTGLKIYVDGVLQSTGINFNTFSGSPVNAVSLAIDQGGLFKGLLQHMAIWNKELSASEALQIYNNGIPGDLLSTSMAANLEGWWKVDGSDISGINGVEDHSSNNNHGTASGGLGNNNSWRFDGVDDYAEGTDVLDKQRTDSFSASFWFSTTTQTQMAGIRKGVTGDLTIAGDAGWQFFIRADSTVPVHGAIGFLMRGPGANNALQVRAGSNLDDGGFHHALVVYTGTSSPAGVTIYIDGVSTTVTTVTNSLSTSTLTTTPFRAGSSSNQPFNGTLQHISIWDKALSPTEVAEVYNSGTPGNLLATGMSSNLEAWYKLDGTDTTDTNGILDHSGRGFHMTALNGLGKSKGYHIEYPDVAINYVPGDYIRIIDSRGTHPENYTDLDLDGVYQVEYTSGRDKIRLVTPEQTNTDWYKLYTLDDEYGPVNKGDVLSTVTKVPT
jgi:hypothetical protein